MPACDVVRVASGTGGRQRFWTVQSGGALKLDGEEEAQYFVCHSAQTDRSCLIQHLQSGAFIEQGEDRRLKLTLSPASATVFSKLRAYSEDVDELLTDSVWLRASTGGIVCADSQDNLAVLVGATNGCPSRDCSFKLLTAQPTDQLMKGMAPHTRDSCPVLQPDSLISSLNLQQTPAPVSIAPKPLSPFFSNRSSAMPIALRRPFRKVSFSELSGLDQSGSELDSTSAPLHGSQGSLSQNSGSFSRSYALKDALSNCIPISPGYSLHSEGSETEECKVRGGHHFDTEDRICSADSLSQLDEACSGVADSASAGPLKAAQQPQPQQQQHQQQHQQMSCDLSYTRLGHQSDQDDDRSSRGTKIHGGNLFSPPGSAMSLKMRSIKSTSALNLMPASPSHAASHRAINGHRTHGSQNALSFLSGKFSPSSPHRIPRAVEQPLDVTQSAPVMGVISMGLKSHGQHGLSSGPQCSGGHSRDCHDNSAALANLRLSRVSGDSSSREPMLPCIMEGVPSQDSEYTMGCPPALDELLGRNPHQEASCTSHSAGHLSKQTARHEARWPSSRYHTLGQSSLPRGFPTGMKRICSSPEMHDSPSSLHEPPIRKVISLGSPCNPSPSKRLHLQSTSFDCLSTSQGCTASFTKVAA